MSFLQSYLHVGPPKLQKERESYTRPRPIPHNSFTIFYTLPRLISYVAQGRRGQASNSFALRITCNHGVWGGGVQTIKVTLFAKSSLTLP